LNWPEIFGFTEAALLRDIEKFKTVFLRQIEKDPFPPETRVLRFGIFPMIISIRDDPAITFYLTGSQSHFTGVPTGMAALQNEVFFVSEYLFLIPVQRKVLESKNYAYCAEFENLASLYVCSTLMGALFKSQGTKMLFLKNHEFLEVGFGHDGEPMFGFPRLARK
jgi:hypothetical protein